MSRLIIIPCCKSKGGDRSGPGGPPIERFLSEEIGSALRSARDRAFAREGTSLEDTSKTVPALDLYTGWMYEAPGFRKAIRSALADGAHVLVESGGYGLIRADEEIHRYEAAMAKTRPVWRVVLSRILTDYIRRNAISSVYVACSQDYAKAIAPGMEKWWASIDSRWYIATCPNDRGNSYQVVPKMVGSAVTELIESGYATGRTWSDSPYSFVIA